MNMPNWNLLDMPGAFRALEFELCDIGLTLVPFTHGGMLMNLPPLGWATSETRDLFSRALWNIPPSIRRQ